jgi:BirA family biotin operon repressor/biotin-[acetyl-CoA-carboxylase] ligase
MALTPPPEARVDPTLFSRLAVRLPIGLMGSAFYPYRTIDSTQAAANRLAGEGAPEGSVVVADHQTRGRGRQGRNWWAEAGSSLLVSIILRPSIPADRLPHFPLLGAVAGLEALKSVANLPIFIKWPNDLLVNQQKVAGILAGAGSADRQVLQVIMGIGINVNQQSFPPDLQGQATSLALASGSEISREAVLEALLRSLDSWYRRYLEQGFSPVREAWRPGAVTLGQAVTISAPALEGVAEDLDEDGALLVRAEGRLVRIFSGEIQ